MENALMESKEQNEISDTLLADNKNQVSLLQLIINFNLRVICIEGCASRFIAMK